MNASYQFKIQFNPSPAMLIVTGLLTIILLAAEWRIFRKAGKHGWAVLVPFYNVWTEFEIICSRGTAMFRLLIPFYNIYWGIKALIKMAHAYGKSTGFGVGMILLSPIFQLILAFGDAQYQGPQQM